MRNVGKSEPSAGPRFRRLWRRPRYQVAAVGAAVLVGAGALIAHAGPARTTAVSDGHGDLNPASASASGSPSPGVSASPSVAPPPTASPMAAKAAPDTVPVRESSVSKNGQTLRVVSARADLTGQRELTWAADAGHQVGTARCTQNFQFSPDSPAAIRPTMLLCWRTSTQKSVYVIEVNLKGRPSEADATGTLTWEWYRLG